MKKTAFLACCVMATAGCKKAAVPPSAAEPVKKTAPADSLPPVTSISPVVKGIPYQLSLKKGWFGFCDDTGSEQIDLATGKQTPGPGRCDKKAQSIQSKCGDDVEIEGHPEGGKDVLFFEGSGFPLEGQSHGCDQDGKLVIVPTVGAVELIDGTSGKVSIVDPGGGDDAVIGSGWIGWSTLDPKHPLRLESVAKAMEHVSVPKE